MRQLNMNMAFSIKWHRKARKELKNIPHGDRHKILIAIENLIENPELGKALKGRWKGLRRLRVGQYRVIYAIKGDIAVILLLKIGHRKEIYRHSERLGQ